MSDLRACGVLVFIVLLVSSRAAPGALVGDLFGINSASQEMHTAITELNTTANGLPEKFQNTIGVSICGLDRASRCVT